MEQPTPIRILETDNNRRGDLFGRLMADFFVAHGYEQPRLNIHKAGRELDLAADHRLEPKRAIAECIATVEPIGGADLNKFVGVLDAEHNDQREVMGYFISLSGFTETAVEQEKNRRRTKIITRTGPEVIDDLVKGRALVAKERATEIAGGCRAAFPHLVLDAQAEILVHQRGWIWALYYSQGKERTHFVLIHSDGTPLARAVADEIIAADRGCGGILHKLGCLNPMPAAVGTDDRIAAARAAYRRYLDSECGFIQLDGMPTDNDVGSRRMRLENLFVPLHLDLVGKRKGNEKPEEAPLQEEARRKEKHQPVGAVLSNHARLALLAAPGGGKSTLIKRLAVAYADPARRGEVADGLPQRDWFPLFFRCRELRALARGSFAELVAIAAGRRPPARSGLSRRR